MPTNSESTRSTDSMAEGETSLQTSISFRLMSDNYLYFFDQRKTRSFKSRIKMAEELPSNMILTNSNPPYLANSVNSTNKNGISTDEDKVKLLRKKNPVLPKISSSVSHTSKLCKFGQNTSGIHITSREGRPYDYLKQMAPMLLEELSDALLVCSKYKTVIPQGAVNAINYTWKELIDGAKRCNIRCVAENRPSHLTLVPDKSKTLRARGFPLQKADSVMKSKSKKMLAENWKENRKQHMAIDNLSPNKSLKTIPCHLSYTIHFSLASSETREWIIKKKDSIADVMEVINLHTRAVNRLQLALKQINEQSTDLEKKGWTKPVILRNYSDIKSVLQGKQEKPSIAPLPLDNEKPIIPEIMQEDPSMKKLHYTLIDGSSMVYYPSGKLAVCQSSSGLPCGGFYTNIFSLDENMLGTFTPFGHGSITIGSQIALQYNKVGGVMASKEGDIVKEWKWQWKAMLSSPITLQVNKYLLVEIVSRVDVTLIYKWKHEYVSLSLSPLMGKSSSEMEYLDTLITNVSFSSKTAIDLCRTIRKKRINKSIILPPLKISLEIQNNDIEGATKLCKLKKQAQHIAEIWMEHYRLALAPLMQTSNRQCDTQNIINPNSLLHGPLSTPAHNHINYLDAPQISASSRLRKKNGNRILFPGNGSRNN